MTRLPTTLPRRRLSLLLAAVLALTLTAASFAAWNSQGNGPAGAAATTMPPGGPPIATVDPSTNGAPGTSVTLSWPAATLANGTPVAGYTIIRYDQNGTPQTTGASCNGLVASTTCSEQNLPVGTWTYTDTPVQQNWAGTASPASSPVTITTPPA